MNDTALARIMESPQLPTLPAVAVRVLELTSRRDVELGEIAKAVEHDPAIATWRRLRRIRTSPARPAQGGPASPAPCCAGTWQSRSTRASQRST